MGSLATAVTVFSVLLATVTASVPPKTVFLEKQLASQVISRQKRANTGNEEKDLPPNLERECIQEVCNYEEAREVFQDSYRTDIFWSVYIDGDQCAPKPCKNGAMCSDSVGGYDCVCKSGFTGVHCETDQTVCVLDKTKGCSQFCKPGYMSYECSCARGWKLDTKDRNKCVTAVTYPCGKVGSASEWETRQTSNVRSNFQGMSCTFTSCPWQAILKNTQSAGFCSGVILKENLVLTSAQCATKYAEFQVAVGKRITGLEEGEQTVYASVVHIHPLYAESPDNDLAVIELRDRIIFKKSAIAACLPERDFADSVLMSGNYTAVVTGWKDPEVGLEVQGPLTMNHLAYDSLSECVERHPGMMTNKMGCTVPRPNADCSMTSGSPLLTFYREAFFLTGVVSQPAGSECTKGYIFQKVSRFLGWLQPLMDSR